MLPQAQRPHSTLVRPSPVSAAILTVWLFLRIFALFLLTQYNSKNNVYLHWMNSFPKFWIVIFSNHWGSSEKSKICFGKVSNNELIGEYEEKWLEKQTLFGNQWWRKRWEMFSSKNKLSYFRNLIWKPHINFFYFPPQVIKFNLKVIKLYYNIGTNSVVEVKLIVSARVYC